MNSLTRFGIAAAVAVAAAGAVILKNRDGGQTNALSEIHAEGEDAPTAPTTTDAAKPLPKLLDLGADKCIPCKMMAPILEQLKEEYAGRMAVEFIDVWKNPDAGKQHGVEMIPTQIFVDADGRELFRHTGFIGKEDILNKWDELGVDISDGKASAVIVREAPAKPEARPRDKVCFLCDGDVNAGTRTVVKGLSEQRILCGPHCYFVHFSSIVGADAKAEDARVVVTDWSSGDMIAATPATYLYGLDEKGRPTIRAFADKATASECQQDHPGALIGWDVLRLKELAVRCGFCDRAVYPEDACKVTVAGATHTYGCCTHCALGVAARTGKDIEVEAHDGLTGEPITVKTLNGSIASLEPPTAIAWFGQKQSEDGQWKSAGCFKQGFFVNQDHLRRWLDARPAMTGREITIARALADKMKLTPEQIAKACKLGECQ